MIKHLLAAAAIVFFSAGILHAQGVPPLNGRVNDYAGMLTTAGKTSLESQLLLYEKTTSTQIVILTVNTIYGQPIEQFGIRVADEWKIGQKGKDNGIIIIAVKEDRLLRIEVGYGMEGVITDLVSGRIISQVMGPLLLKGDNDLAFSRAVDEIIKTAKGEYGNESNVAVPEATKEPVRGEDSHSLIFFMFIVIYLLGKISRILGGVVGASATPLLVHFLFMPLGIMGFIGFIFLGFIAGIIIPSLGFLGYFFGGGRYGSSGGSFGGGGGTFGGGGASGRW